MASLPAISVPTAAPISSLKYEKCQVSGASTTPSRAMNRPDLRVPIGVLLRTGCVTDSADGSAGRVAGEDGDDDRGGDDVGQHQDELRGGAGVGDHVGNERERREDGRDDGE